ncbi:MAG: LacI family DNA-binding transcriptional regulator [Pseudomonadota bacterium]
MRPTTHDIAREAGVSLATVDRVINERPGVRERTIEKVREAIERLGYVRDVSAANLARQRTYQFVYAVPDAYSEFTELLHQTIGNVGQGAHVERTQISTLPIPMEDPHALVSVLNKLDTDNVDGVALMTLETPHVRDALLRLTDAGVAVVALISDLPNTSRHFFVGIDNVAAGKTAGKLMGRFIGNRQGSIIVLTNSMQSTDSIERRLGFDEVINAQFPQLTVLPTLEAHGDAERVTRLINTSFKQRTDICGIYSLSSGNRSLTECLNELSPEQRPITIMHELTDHTATALHEGHVDAVITQDVGHIVRSSLRLLRSHTDQININPEQERIRIEIMLKENLP